MKSNFFPLLVLMVSLLGGCYPPPEFPDSPQITFEDIKYFDKPGPQDSLAVTIIFQDGDGDLGLSDSDRNDARYAPSIVLLDDDDMLVEFTDDDVFDCENWLVGDFLRNDPGEDDSIFLLNDTIRVLPNPNAFNFEVDLLKRQPDGTYELINFLVINPNGECGETLYGVFERLEDDTSGGPLEGTLTYGINTSQLFFSTFLFTFDDTLKAQVRIRDRSLNVSNTVESAPFTFNGLIAEN